jgi:hypothetical protein
MTALVNHSMIAATMPAPQRSAVFRISPNLIAVGACRHDGAIITR